MAETNFRPSSADGASDLIALAAGTAVGRYTIRRVLGQGSFGITYLAVDGQLGREVALKEYLPTSFAMRHEGLAVLPTSIRSADDFSWGRQRFVEEARTLAGFRRLSGIVHVYDFLEANGTAYMVMELVHGLTLEQMLERDGALPAAAVERILRPLLDGLATVHRAGFVHRDVKPANILIDGEGHPTLIDFGAARAAVASRTAAMTAVYTPSYAALEQFTDARQGSWTDIYGLSATLYRAITGRKPPSAIDRTLEDRYEPLARLKPAGYSVELLKGIDRGLAVRPADRPQTIEEWSALLYPRAARPAEAAPAKRRSTVPAYIAVAAMVAVIAVTGLLLVERAMRTDPLRDTGVEDRDRALAARNRSEAAALEQRRQAEQTAAREQEAQRLEADRRTAERERSRQQVDEATRKAAEDEARRRADDARRQAENERLARLDAEREVARQNAAGETARRKAEEEATNKRAAEAAEWSLNLSNVDRQRLQVALTAQGFNTAGTDGIFGPTSREKISFWQKAHNLPVTGFVDGSQRDRLLKESATAVTKFDEDQKRAADEKRQSEQALSAPQAKSLPQTTEIPKTTPNAEFQASLQPCKARRWSDCEVAMKKYIPRYTENRAMAWDMLAAIYLDANRLQDSFLAYNEAYAAEKLYPSVVTPEVAARAYLMGAAGALYRLGRKSEACATLARYRQDYPRANAKDVDDIGRIYSCR